MVSPSDLLTPTTSPPGSAQGSTESEDPRTGFAALELLDPSHKAIGHDHGRDLEPTDRAALLQFLQTL
jgi:hypothetical protein